MLTETILPLRTEPPASDPCNRSVTSPAVRIQPALVLPPFTEALASSGAVDARRPWTVEDHYRAAAAAKVASERTVAISGASVN